MNIKGYRTLILNLAIGFIGILEAFNWTDFFDPGQVGYILTGVSIINIILCSLTTTPVGEQLHQRKIL